MKKRFLFAFLLILSPLLVVAKDEAPDPFYLATPPLDASQVEVQYKKEDPRTLSEKIREKFHLPPTKKIYLHNIDKTNQPITVNDYYLLSVEKKRKDFEIPEPKFSAEEGYVYQEPHYRVIRYNNPPGQRNIDLTTLVKYRKAKSPAILSPDKTKMVYTVSMFYPRYAQTASAVYFIPTEPNDAYDVLYKTNVVQGDVKPILTVGLEEMVKYQYKTLFPIDWSKDSTKIAFKEKIGSNLHETWKTNIIIYDFETKTWKRLTAVREAIIYWWRYNKQIELNDYMWDIFPIGWDKNNPERLVVYAYAFTSDRPLFLGTWSIDYNEEKSQLVSIDKTDVEIDLNGFGLKKVKNEN